MVELVPAMSKYPRGTSVRLNGRTYVVANPSMIVEGREVVLLAGTARRLSDGSAELLALTIEEIEQQQVTPTSRRRAEHRTDRQGGEGGEGGGVSVSGQSRHRGVTFSGQSPLRHRKGKTDKGETLLPPPPPPSWVPWVSVVLFVAFIVALSLMFR
jgi:hypothetical protein